MHLCARYKRYSLMRRTDTKVDNYHAPWGLLRGACSIYTQYPLLC